MAIFNPKPLYVKWPDPFGPLFDLCDPGVSETESPRLSAQCQAIYTRLQSGPATNDELSRISRKYTSRISDLRKNGIGVECISHDTNLA